MIAWPQVSYLIDSDFLPIHYAQDRASSGGISDSVSFLAAQLADHLFFIVLLIIGGLFGRGAWVARADRLSDKTIFIWLVVLAPVVMVALLPVVAGMGLKPMWGTPMFNFSGLVLLYFLGNRLSLNRSRRIIISSLFLLPIVGTLYTVQHIYRADMSDKPMRTLWPQSDISTELRDTYLQDTSAPLKIVVAPYWLAGLIASNPEHPVRVSVDGDPVKSPWVKSIDIAQDGALVVWLSGQSIPSTQSKFLEEQGVSLTDARQMEFIWHPSKADKPIQIEYIAIPPSTKK